jgi:hypothetical protein
MILAEVVSSKHRFYLFLSLLQADAIQGFSQTFISNSLQLLILVIVVKNPQLFLRKKQLRLDGSR